ncbi:MAG: hypothetical protein ACKOHG_09415, partial [Planctomycetia bacterium]
MDPDSLEVLQLAPPGPAVAPWVDRTVKSPAVRSGYLSLAAHLLVGILLAWFALDREAPPRARPLVLSIGPPTEEEPAGDPVAGVEIGAASQVDASEQVAAQTDSGAVADPTGGLEPPLVAVHPADVLPDIAPPADAAGTETDGSDPVAASPAGRDDPPRAETGCAVGPAPAGEAATGTEPSASAPAASAGGAMSGSTSAGCTATSGGSR